MTGSITPGATSQLADGTAAGSWVLDPAGSAAEFRVRHFWGVITVRGTLGPMAGEAAVSPLHMASMTALGTVKARFARA